MKKNVNSELIDEENPEWTDGVFKRAASLEESGLPESFKVAARRGRPSKTNPKVSTTIRFDADIIEAFKLKGAGWQSRMNDALRDWLKTHSAT